MNRLALLALLLAACDDDGSPINPPDAPPSDGGVDAPPGPPQAIVVSGTFTPGEPGVMSALDLEALTVEQRVAPTGAVAEDPLIREHAGLLYVVNRAAGNNVTILDRSFGLVEQLATGAGSNPQDVAVVGNDLFVPAYGTAGVVVATRGSTATTTIDLSALDPDGFPDCVSAFAVGNDVYVACGLLESFVAVRAAKVVVIDATTKTVRTMVDLPSRNPFGTFERMPEQDGGHLVIPTVPDFVDFSTGCVEKITPGTTPVAAGCAVTNLALDSYAASVRFQRAGNATLMWTVAAKFDSQARGVLRVVEDGTLRAEPVSDPAAEVLVDVAVCPNGDVVAADSTLASNGLRVYRDSVERTTMPLAIGLKPNAAHGLVCY
jgi:hypothetical protein